MWAGWACQAEAHALPLQAYTDELVELHRRLMALRERNVLQQVGRGPGALPSVSLGLQPLRSCSPCRS